MNDNCLDVFIENIVNHVCGQSPLFTLRALNICCIMPFNLRFALKCWRIHYVACTVCYVFSSCSCCLIFFHICMLFDLLSNCCMSAVQLPVSVVDVRSLSFQSVMVGNVVNKSVDILLFVTSANVGVVVDVVDVVVVGKCC